MTPALRLPHPLILLLACLAVAAAASWVVPAGRYERREDAAVGRTVVVPGTYQRVEPAPVGPFAAAVAVPKGLADAASVVF
ncbi:MAG: YfcC family protein, partial [bacterium]